MNWEAIAAIGQMLGSVAVFVTLGYLAVQIRQNTVALRHSSRRGVIQDANAWRYQMIDSPEVAELYLTGLRAPGDLSPNDRFRFRMLLDALFNHWDHAFLFGEQGVIQIANIRRILAQPGGAGYWSRARDPGSIFTPAFIEYIDGLTVTSGGQ
jgi:hypothetical protein